MSRWQSEQIVGVHLNEEIELVGIAEVTDAGRRVGATDNDL